MTGLVDAHGREIAPKEQPTDPETMTVTPKIIKDLYVLYIKGKPKGYFSKKERQLIFEFANFVDEVIEGKYEQKTT